MQLGDAMDKQGGCFSIMKVHQGWYLASRQVLPRVEAVSGNLEQQASQPGGIVLCEGPLIEGVQ